jgi:hypothetical protein
MKQKILLMLVVVSLALSANAAHADPVCDDGYSVCMSGCATDRSPERCMQRCQDAERRCAKLGVFRIPVGFLLNKSRMQDISRAKGQLPRRRAKAM